jgi:hypothetical protein
MLYENTASMLPRLPAHGAFRSSPASVSRPVTTELPQSVFTRRMSRDIVASPFFLPALRPTRRAQRSSPESFVMTNNPGRAGAWCFSILARAGPTV